MFDFAWSEIALIGIVALIAIGPKDLPVAMKAISGMIKKARRMAGEFQTHVDEMVREADLGEVRDQFNNLRRMDIKGAILKAVDDDGSIRSGLTPPAGDFTPAPPPVPVHDSAPSDLQDAAPAPEEVAVAAHPVPEEASQTPAFVPPRYAPAAGPARPAAPAFIPPHLVSPASTRQTARSVEHA